MTVQSDVLTLGTKALVEMFVFDPSNLNPAWSVNIMRWHPGTTVGNADIQWQGVIYNQFPVETEGFEQNASGKLPRPKMRVSNIGGVMGQVLRSMDGALGAKVTRKRTFGKYLDAVNFVGGNPNADPNTYFPDETFFLARKAVENPVFVEYDLAVAFDVMGVKLPRRQVIAATCQWVYRDSETCTYAGAAVLNDPVFPGVDKCGKQLTSCRLRFGQFGNLPHSGFPASLLAKAT